MVGKLKMENASNRDIEADVGAYASIRVETVVEVVAIALDVVRGEDGFNKSSLSLEEVI